jgi:outer membrane protein TolC
MDVLSGQKYPNLVWTAGYHYGRPELYMGNDPKYMGYAMTALQFKFNLYNGDKVTSQQRQTQQQIEIVFKQKQQLVNSLNNAIRSAKRERGRARRQMNAAQLSLEASHSLVQDAQNSLKAGVITALDYQNAITAEAVAQCSVKQAQFMEKMAQLKVYFAIGKELKY